MKAAFIYTPDFTIYDYGAGHPMKTIRLKLCRDLLDSYHIFEEKGVQLIKPLPAKKEEVTLFHNEDYINTLELDDADPSLLYRYGLGFGDNPKFKGVYEWSMLSAGASIHAARMVTSGEASVAFNIAGGLHHAMPGKASGFCYINDPAVAIHDLLRQGKRVAYIDIDAHHGDGVQFGFYNTDKVLTISLHESGEFLFPGTGFVEEIGEGSGKGYSVNLPFYPGTGDDVFVRGFDEVVPPLIEAFKPDVIVTQLGVDTMTSDPLAHLNLTTNGFCRMIERFRSFGIPWVALGGGGYDITAVARSWTLAFGIMCGADINDEIPADCLNNLKKHGMEGTTLRDHDKGLQDDSTAKRWAETQVKYIRENIFPFYGI